jgi:hypothetical protein
MEIIDFVDFFVFFIVVCHKYFRLLILRLMTTCPTVCVSCGGWEGGLALETEKAQSHENAQKTRRVPTVSCTLCWAAIVMDAV